MTQKAPPGVTTTAPLATPVATSTATVAHPIAAPTAATSAATTTAGAPTPAAAAPTAPDAAPASPASPAAPAPAPLPRKMDAVLAASAAHLQSTITKAKTLYATGATHTKAKAVVAQGLLTAQVVTAATAQSAAFGASCSPQASPRLLPRRARKRTS
jgi:S-DNA-T family DNA segregation ATPase FtsK/SpoIIIE